MQGFCSTAMASEREVCSVATASDLDVCKIDTESNLAFCRIDTASDLDVIGIDIVSAVQLWHQTWASAGRLWGGSVYKWLQPFLLRTLHSCQALVSREGCLMTGGLDHSHTPLKGLRSHRRSDRSEWKEARAAG